MVSFPFLRRKGTITQSGSAYVLPLPVNDVYLTKCHCIECSLVTFRSNTRAATCIYSHFHFCIERLQKNGVTKYANTSAKTNQFHFRTLYMLEEVFCTKGELFDVQTFRDIHFLRNFPTIRSFDAMFHRKISSLLCVKVVGIVRVLCENHLVTTVKVLPNLFLYFGKGNRCRAGNCS